MIAVALDNFSVVIVDLESKRVVRIFDDHNGNITDMVSGIRLKLLLFFLDQINFFFFLDFSVYNY